MKIRNKIDLHLHIDGSVRCETVYELSRKYHIEPECHLSLEEIRKSMVIADGEYDPDFLTFEPALRVMQNEDGLRRVTKELIERLESEGLIYAELRFAPQYHLRNGLTQEEVATRMGKSRSAVTNALRLLNLNEDELDALKNGLITAGHARCLIGIEDTEIRAKMLAAAINGASVRDIERMAQLAKKPQKAAKKEEKNKLYSEVELSLRSELHRKVKIVSTGKGKGKITIEFYSDKELCDFANKLTD